MAGWRETIAGWQETVGSSFGPEAEKKKAAQLQGRSTSHASMVAYTPEAERGIASKPAFVTYRESLQNTDGSFKFAPDPLGTGAMIPGRYWVDWSGKYQPY